MRQFITGESNPKRVPPVLVVDDNHDAADMLALLLRHWGYRVLIAYDGVQALGLLSAEWPAVALIDVNMPRMSGVELARKLRQISQGRPLWIYAVTANDVSLQGPHPPVFDACLLKPACPALLCRHVERDCSKAVEFSALN